jgi:DNA-directed RNA polymerase subunit RPC12/RpoP
MKEREMANYVCAGCGKVVTDRDRFPQGKENYCMMCNKKYHLWDRFLRDMYAEFDNAKAEIKAKKRKEIFGTSEQTDAAEAEYLTRKPAISEEQRERLDRTLLQPDTQEKPMTEFSPDLQKTVEDIKRKK